MLNKRIISLALSLVMILTLFSVSSFAESENNVAPLAIWDMSNVLNQGSASGKNSIIVDASGNLNNLQAYFGVNTALVGNSMYATKNYVYNNDLYNYFSPSTGTADILKAFNNAFTYEAWFKMDGSSFNNTALFSINNNTNAFITQLELRNIEASSDKNLIFRRKFETAEHYYNVNKAIKSNEWTHLIVSYDAASVYNEPIIMINGEVVGFTDMFASTVAGNALVDTTNYTNCDFGRFMDGSWHFMKGSAFGKIAVYNGDMNEAQAKEIYNSEKADYETDFPVEIYNWKDSLVSASDIMKLNEDGNKIKIDFSGADLTTVNSDNVYIDDITDLTNVTRRSIDSSFEENILTLSNLVLTNQHSYKLSIGTDDLTNAICDVNGNPIRDVAQTVVFKCDCSSDLVPVAKYEVPDSGFSISKDGNGNNYAVLNNQVSEYADSNLYLLAVGECEEINSKKKAASASYPAYYITSPEKIVNELDDSFTLETWIEIDNPHTTSSTNGLFSIYDSTQTQTTGILTVYVTNDGKIWFIRGFDNGNLQSYSTAGTITFGKLSHIIISYDAQNPKNAPILYVDGQKYSSNVTLTPSGNTPATASSLTTPKITFGNASYYSAYSEVQNRLPNHLSTLNLYSGVVSEYEAYTMYSSTKDDYIADYKVNMYDSNNNLISPEDYTSVLPDGNSFTIDFTDADKETVNANTVYITDITTNEKLAYTGSWSDNIYTINQFTLTDNHDYTLTIENVKDTSGDDIRNVPFVVKFARKSEIKQVARYALDNKDSASSFVSGAAGLYYSQLSNSAADSSFNNQLVFRLGNTTTPRIVKFCEKDLNSKYIINGKGAAGYHYIPDCKELQKIFDDRVTMEAYVRYDAKSGANSLTVFEIGNLGDSTCLYIDSSEYHLILRRDFVGGTKYYQTPSMLKTDSNGLIIPEWNHIVVSYDPTSASDVPDIYINGIKQPINSYSGGTPTDLKTVASYDDSTIKIGFSFYQQNIVCESSFAKAAFYTGCASEYDAKLMYQETLKEYEAYATLLIDENDNNVKDLSESSKVKAKMYVNSDELSPQLIIAVYRNNRLSDIKTCSVKVDGAYETDYVNIQEGDEIRVMCWDKINSLTPMLETLYDITK